MIHFTLELPGGPDQTEVNYITSRFSDWLLCAWISFTVISFSRFLGSHHFQDTLSAWKNTVI
uniref:Uncharacterized protein n=1 Tax=Anguilla anguilla TaxID=7936 RepID=A0A0E9Q9N2_ANGAN